MKIPYTKAHGASNDFLLTWSNEAPTEKLSEVAERICHRYTGVGADGWLLVTRAPEGANYHGSIRLINSDGSEAEMSGNGTRCAAAFLLHAGIGSDEITILTGAGLKSLKVISRQGLEWIFEMNMGKPQIVDSDLHFPLPIAGGNQDVTILNVGNPQCALVVENFDFDWQTMGAELEKHPHFPNRTNVSFIQAVDEHTIDVRFFERGAGVTMSSGTGSTGAAVTSILRGIVKSPVKVLTPAGPLNLKWEARSADVLLVGPAEIVASGDIYLQEAK